MTNQQPEALRLADELDAYHTRACHKEAATELRRLHEAYEALLNDYHGVLETLDEMQAAVAAEREWCAKVCEAMADKHGWEGSYATECAAAIRARSTKE